MRAGCPMSAHEKREKALAWNPSNQHSVLLQLLEDIGRPAEGKSSCFSPARGEKVFFGLLSTS